MRRWLSVALGAALGLTLLAPAVAAKPPPVTKMKFKLDAHEVAAGAEVTGGVHVWTRDGKAWVPLADAVLTVKVDGMEVDELATDGDGYAAVAHPATEGEHVMKIVFAGDDLHKRARRAQGFSATAGDPVPDPVPAPTVPDAPVLTASSTVSGVVHLEWTAPVSDGGLPITGYDVYRGDTSGSETPLLSVDAATLSVDDPTGLSGSTYFYVVVAVNAVGGSVWSNEEEVIVT